MNPITEYKLSGANNVLFFRNRSYILCPTKGRKSSLTEINFINDKRLTYPNWIINLRGKDIYQLYNTLYKETGNNLINNASALKYLRATEMVPEELVRKIESILD